MGVGVDDDTAVLFFGEAEIAVVEVEPLGRGVVLDGDAQFGGASQDRTYVEGIGFASQELSAGGVAEDPRVGILDGTEHASGHLFATLVKARVDAGDDHVHLGEDFVVEVERAIGQNVDLDAGEDADAAFHLLVHFTDAADVFERALFIEAVGHGQVFGVVGDGDVLIAPGECGVGHFANGVVAIGGGGVHVHVAFDIGRFNEPG